MEETNNLLDFKTLDEIEGIEIKIIGKDYIPIHHANYNLLAGNGGTGKSLVSLKMICHFLMEFPTKKALGIYSEDTKGDIVNRLNNITYGLNITTKEVMERTFFKTLDNDDGAVFCRKERGQIIEDAYLKKFKINIIKHDVGIIILDPLERFHSGLSENDESDMKYFTVMIQKIAIETESSIVLLHHTSKGNHGGFRGSSVIANKGRVAYNIRKNYTIDKASGLDVIREGWEHSVILTTIKDNHYVARHCDIIQNKQGQLDLPVFGKKQYAPIEIIYEAHTEAKEVKTIDTVNVSVANHNDEKNAHGFERREVQWNDLLDVITMGRAYAPAGFKNGHRKNENYLGDTNVVFLDIDSGMTFKEAQELFKNLKCFMVTTRSHQKDKKGVVCDRFRVCIKLDKPIKLDTIEYKIAMQSIFDFFGNVDRSTKDPARFYFSSPLDSEVWYSKSEEPLEWELIYKKAKAIRSIEDAKRKDYAEKQTTSSDIEVALKTIDADCDYATWVEIGMAIHSELGEGGFHVWDTWSRGGSKYNEREMETKWRSFKSGSGVSIGTLFFHAKSNYSNNISMPVL